MNPIDNPYSPGAGMEPFELAGRDAELKAFHISIGRIENGLNARSLVYYGLRGVGKTVLLREMYNVAKQKKWTSAFVETSPKNTLRTLVGSALSDTIADMAKPNAGHTVLKALKTILSFVKLEMNSTGTFSIGVDLSTVDASNAATGDMIGDFGRMIRDLSKATEENNVGIALFIDEAQDLSLEDLRAINQVVHQANQERYRIVVVMAGLPTLPARLAESTSYAERLYDYRVLKELDWDAARLALTKPALAKGVDWEEDAVEEAMTASSCYSYFIQEYGYSAWDCAKSSPITMADMEIAKSQAIDRLDVGFFRSRWDRVSDAQKEFMQTMAEYGEESVAMSDIANRIGMKSNQLSPRRSELISKGLIYSPKRGYVAFTVPQMAAFIKRQPE
jgi:hypothetical protein